VGGGEHHIVAFVGVLDDHVAGVVDEVGVVAGAAGHDIGAAAAVEQVRPGIAVEQVGEAVAVTLQVGGALQHQGLHIRGQDEVGG
jgi:hypothetical protein